jgi:hypothetical protein
MTGYTNHVTNTLQMTRQFFRQSLLPPFRTAALRIRGCTFSLKPLRRPCSV